MGSWASLHIRPPTPLRPALGGQLPGPLAAGSQVSLPAATRRKLFELARAFSEKTKMRKSKRKHLLKHQSYPFWPGPAGGVVGPKGTGTLGWAPRGCTFPQPWARALPESCCQPAVPSLCARRHHHAQAWGEGQHPPPPLLLEA